MSTDVALPPGYALGEYRIESLLGTGGFGLTYLATDTNLNLKVAIKEYLPTDWVERAADHAVKSKSQELLETFNWGRARFLEESRTLASFHHPNIVRVMRFFKANETAYMVMEFVAGQALHDWIRTRRPLDERTVLAVALPLLDGLEVVHAGGFLHRDIKPGNIFIRGNGNPVLIDFGSARTVAANTELTTIVSPGFAPVEQYDSRGGQGPWSDLYALGGVLYWMVTGQPPIEAPARAFSDPMAPAVKAADSSRFSQALLKAIDWALTPSKDARPKSVAELRSAFRGVPVSTLATAVAAPSSPTSFPATERIVPPPPTVDAETVEKLVAELAAHIGPIADKLVKSQLRKGASLSQIVDKFSSEIADPKERAAFVYMFTVQNPSSGQKPGVPSPPTAASRAPASRAPSIAAPSELRFTPTQIEKAETDLAQHLGAVARVVVKRAAAKARDLSELYLLLADEIEDPYEKKRFIRKAISVSRK